MAAAGVGCSGSYRGLSAIDQSGDEVDGAPGVQLMVDANGGYTVAQARRVGAALDQFGVVGVEVPVSSEDFDCFAVVRFAVVRSAVRCDVTAGEAADRVTGAGGRR